MQRCNTLKMQYELGAIVNQVIAIGMATAEGLCVPHCHIATLPKTGRPENPSNNSGRNLDGTAL